MTAFVTASLVKIMHRDLPVVSIDTVNVTEQQFVDIGGHPSYPMVIAHGKKKGVE